MSWKEFKEKPHWAALYYLYLVLSNNTLNILLGLFSGILINVYTADPTDKRYAWPLSFLLTAIFISILLSILNNRIEHIIRADLSRSPLENFRYAFRTLGQSSYLLLYITSVILYISFNTLGFLQFLEAASIQKTINEKKEDQQLTTTQQLQHIEKLLLAQDSAFKALQNPKEKSTAPNTQALKRLQDQKSKPAANNNTKP